MHRRRTARPLALAAAALVMAACAPSTSGDDGDKTTLTVWSWRTEDVAAYKTMFDRFTKTHPDINVEFKPTKNTEYDQVLATGLTQESGPDVAQLRGGGRMQPLAAAGSLLPLDGKVPGLEEFPAPVLGGAKGRADGKIYGVPFAVQTLQVFYNKKLFAAQGITPPTTWAELIALCDKLKAAGTAPFAVSAGSDGTWTLPIVHEIFGNSRYGGKAFQDAVLAGRKNFTSPEFVASLQLVKDLQPYFYKPDDVTGIGYNDGRLVFTQGKAAMYPGGSFELGYFQQQASDLELGTFQVPPPPGSPVQTAVTPGFVDGSYGVSAKSKHQKEALELVSWMATKEFGQMFTDALKQPSAVPGVTPGDPLLAEMLANYEKSGRVSYLTREHFQFGQPFGDAQEREGLQKMLNSPPQMTAAQVGAHIQKGISQWFKPGQ
jgi:raffinose/stachyose/melibiose transport system substrate-binding protein